MARFAGLNSVLGCWLGLAIFVFAISVDTLFGGFFGSDLDLSCDENFGVH